MLFVASLNMQCQNVGLSLKECVTSGLTHVQRFSGSTGNLETFEVQYKISMPPSG